MGVVWTFFSRLAFLFLPPSLWETARYRLKYCLKGPLSPKQPTNQPMKFCYSTSFTLPKQFQKARSVLKDGSRFLGLFWKEKNFRLIAEEIGISPFSRSSQQGLMDLRQFRYLIYNSQNNSAALSLGPVSGKVP